MEYVEYTLNFAVTVRVRMNLHDLAILVPNQEWLGISEEQFIDNLVEATIFPINNRKLITIAREGTWGNLYPVSLVLDTELKEIHQDTHYNDGVISRDI